MSQIKEYTRLENRIIKTVDEFTQDPPIGTKKFVPFIEECKELFIAQGFFIRAVPKLVRNVIELQKIVESQDERIQELEEKLQALTEAVDE